MKIKIIIICFLLLSSGLFSPVSAQRKNRKQQPAQITLVSKVVGTDGQPIVGAYIYTNEGKDISRSDQDGTFTVKAETKEMVLIEADGYESVVLPAAGINKSSVTLVASTYQSGRADEVNVPFVPLKRRNIIGAVDQISIDKMRDIYYADDWRGYLQTAGTGIFDAANIRYAGNVVVIDGMMKGDEGLSFADYLSPDEIESISVLKDASSRILYGGTGQGVINIRILDEVDSVRVEIEDNGKGISTKDLGKIFERFYRTDASRNSSTGGSGIGLSIVKKIIEDHGGYIWATSKDGEGTCLHFVIRKYREAEENE